MQILQALSSLNRFLVISSASAVTRYKTWDEISRRIENDTKRSRTQQNSAELRISLQNLARYGQNTYQVVERIFSANSVASRCRVGNLSVCTAQACRVEISKRRTESLWTLQAVDVASVNLSRLSRLEWRRIWPVLSAHLVAVACDVRPDVSMCAINALKQMSLRF